MTGEADPADQRYSDEEAERRFQGILRAALNTPPKPLKDRPRERPESKGPTMKGKFRDFSSDKEDGFNT